MNLKRRVIFLHPKGVLTHMVVSLALMSAASCSAKDLKGQAAKPPQAATSEPRTFDKRIAEKLGVKNVAYLLAVDIDGNIVPFVPDDPKASFRTINPAREKLTMDLHEIESFTIVAGKRNPLCVLFIGGSGRRLWMESCP